jgi:hypothetical protein
MFEIEYTRKPPAMERQLNLARGPLSDCRRTSASRCRGAVRFEITLKGAAS